MNRIVILLLMTFSTSAFGQINPTDEAQPIVAEGRLLYKSEMASWYGTDLFLQKYTPVQNIGGYLSYTDKQWATCIFFSKTDKPTVIGTITFDSTYNKETASINLTERDFTPKEYELYTIRQLAFAIINTDTLFKTYKNTNLNLIPLITGAEKKVYVLTGPKNSGVVLFGNDYLLTFDSANKLLVQKQLHKNLIPVYYEDKKAQDKQAFGAMHGHSPETGQFITATDICTLMLYEKFAKWQQHIVVSEKYMNIWDCTTDRLTVIPRDIPGNGQEKKNSKDKKTGD